MITNLYSQVQTLKMGDDIVTYYQKNQQNYIESQRLLANVWKDSTVKILVAKNDSPKILITDYSEIIGAISNNEIILDIDGDHILDIVAPQIVLPYWVYDNIAKKSDNDNIKLLLDQCYQAFQSNMGAVEENPIYRKITDIFSDNNDIDKLDNKDLIYRIWFYSEYYYQIPEVCFQDLVGIYKGYQERFDDPHPILLEYLCESSIRLGHIDDANLYYGFLKIFAPDFIPGKIIGYRLENDRNKKEKMRNELKNNYPDHWLIKQL